VIFHSGQTPRHTGAVASSAPTTLIASETIGVMGL